MKRIKKMEIVLYLYLNLVDKIGDYKKFDMFMVPVNKITLFSPQNRGMLNRMYYYDRKWIF